MKSTAQLYAHFPQFVHVSLNCSIEFSCSMYGYHDVFTLEACMCDDSIDLCSSKSTPSTMEYEIFPTEVTLSFYRKLYTQFKCNFTSSSKINT